MTPKLPPIVPPTIAEVLAVAAQARAELIRQLAARRVYSAGDTMTADELHQRYEQPGSGNEGYVWSP